MKIELRSEAPEARYLGQLLNIQWIDGVEGLETEGGARVALVGQARLPALLTEASQICPLFLIGWSLSEADCELIRQSPYVALVANLSSDSDLSTWQSALLTVTAWLRAPAKRAPDRADLPQHMIGHSRAMDDLLAMVEKIGHREVTVLITGESGSGKELLAKTLHEVSARADGPYVPVNCGAIPAELLESELFGHEKGAFTGAISSRPGRFELAQGGTLFLDEIGDMPLNMQVKLLRVLQERKFERVGGIKTIEADVRIIAATHKNLEQMIEQERFREDLYFRLNVFPIEVPPLRERLEDLPLLVSALAERVQNQGLGQARLTQGAIAALQQYSWPGNVRELANLLERLAILHDGEWIGAESLPSQFLSKQDSPSIKPPPAFLQSAAQTAELVGPAVLPDEGIDLKQHLEDLERRFINQALDQADGVVARAADLLSIRRTTLVEKMRKYGIQRK